MTTDRTRLTTFIMILYMSLYDYMNLSQPQYLIRYIKEILYDYNAIYIISNLDHENATSVLCERG